MRQGRDIFLCTSEIIVIFLKNSVPVGAKELNNAQSIAAWKKKCNWNSRMSDARTNSKIRSRCDQNFVQVDKTFVQSQLAASRNPDRILPNLPFISVNPTALFFSVWHPIFLLLPPSESQSNVPSARIWCKRRIRKLRISRHGGETCDLRGRSRVPVWDEEGSHLVFSFFFAKSSLQKKIAESLIERVVRCAQIRFFTNRHTDNALSSGRLFVFLSILYFARGCISRGLDIHRAPLFWLTDNG